MALQVFRSRVGLAVSALVLVATGACGKSPSSPERRQETTAGSAPLCPPQPPGSAPQAVDRMREAILRSLNVQPGWQVGDVGVGGGWFASRIARVLGPSGHIYGTDIDPQVIAAAQANQHPGEQDAPVRLTLVKGPRDTGLDDLPDNHLDLLLMIDSLCFHDGQDRADNLAYLKRFLRVLKPGGRFVHHMDCTCPTTLDKTEKLFADAGYEVIAPRLQLGCDELAPEACPTAEHEVRARYVGVYRKRP